MIKTRMCMSLDGYVTTPDGWPAQLADRGFSPQSYGLTEFQAGCDAVLMGARRSSRRWAPSAGRARPRRVRARLAPSRRTPEHFVVESDRARLLEQIGSASVHLVSGPQTIETFRRLGALDELGLVVLPLLLGAGMQLTPAVATDARLTLTGSRALPNGALEVSYACS